MHFATFFRKQLHFLLDNLKDEHLFIFIENTVTALIKDIDEFLRRINSKQVVDMLALLFEHKSNVSLVKFTFLPEVGLLDGMPDLFTLACATNKWSGLHDKLVNLVTGNICQTAKCLVHASW